MKRGNQHFGKLQCTSKVERELEQDYYQENEGSRDMHVNMDACEHIERENTKRGYSKEGQSSID